MKRQDKVYVLMLLIIVCILITFKRHHINLRQDYSISITTLLHSKEAKLLNNRSSLNLGTKFQHSHLDECPPHEAVGAIKVWFDAPNYTTIHEMYPYLGNGGHGRPNHCRAKQKVAIIVPYRDRDQHLRIFLHNIHSLLTKQLLDYAIFVVEPLQNQTFNRAKLINIGYTEAMIYYPWDCFIFHDVDLLPENDMNMYTCSDQPRHMSVAIDKFKYSLPYKSIFGGAGAISADQFRRLNGFSNDYWGWGGEDDDLSKRVKLAGMKLHRSDSKLARYKMIKHEREKSNGVNKARHHLMSRTSVRWRADGLNTLQYQVKKIDFLPTHTHILADLMESELRQTTKPSSDTTKSVSQTMKPTKQSLPNIV